jgi:iron-sulfur cluster assembly accessory protein
VGFCVIGHWSIVSCHFFLVSLPYVTLLITITLHVKSSVILKDGFEISKINFMIHLSPAAASEIRRLKLKQPQNVLFRLAIKPGGCSGWFYDMSFDETLKVGDRVFDLNAIQLVVDADSLNYINGLTVDYSEDLMGGGFRFHNPQAIATCGCGNSFDLKSGV